jgi:hypothetical protein
MAFTKQQPSNLKASKEQEHHQEHVFWVIPLTLREKFYWH